MVKYLSMTKPKNGMAQKKPREDSTKKRIPTKKKGTTDKVNKKPGRKSKFKRAYCKMIIDYFSIEPNYEKELVHTTAKGSTWIDYKKWANKLPTFLGFANSIGVDDDTLSNWAKEENKKKYPGFFGAYTRAKKLQKYFIIENGLNGLYNPQFAIFTAKNITDMKDKQEVKHGLNEELESALDRLYKLFPK